MPTYEYACKDCGTHVEVFQRFGEDALRECGLCGGELRKVFHPAGIVFKGSGFYATDSRASKGSASGDGAKDAKPSDTKASKPTEAKEPRGTDGQTSKPSEASAAKEKTA
jgi:putative FmdB family regulatory protein